MSTRENVPNVSNHLYSLTPFNNAQKILSVTFKDRGSTRLGTNQIVTFNAQNSDSLPASEILRQ